jgi:hypothetical protein
MSDLEQQLRDLSKEKFEALIHQLLDAKYPGADIKRVEGSGGDKGIDSFQGTLSIGAAIWQDKHFRDRIRDPQKRQILKSIRTAFAEVQASDVLRELIHNRPLRDVFFPDNSISNVLKVRQIAMRTEGLSRGERGNLAAEHVQQYLDGIKELEPRLKSIVSIGPESTPHQIRGPGLVMSFKEGERTTHFFARDVNDYNLDPIEFGITAPPELADRLGDAIDSGVPFSVAAGQIAEIHSTSPLVKTFFEGKDLAAFRFEVRPILPNQLQSKEIPLRLVAGSGASAKEIPYLPFKVATLGRREATMVSVGRVPIEVTLRLRPFDAIGVQISMRTKVLRAEVRSLNHVLQFLDELERAGEIKVFSLETSKPLAEASGNFSNTLNHPAWLRRIIEDAAIVAEFVEKDIHVPDRISERDVENITLLKRIATAEEFFDVDMSLSLIKLEGDKDRALAALGGEPITFQVGLDSTRFTVFDQEIDAGPVTFEAQSAVPKFADKIREAYLAAHVGEAVQWTMHCDGPCRFISAKVLSLGSTGK